MGGVVLPPAGGISLRAVRGKYCVPAIAGTLFFLRIELCQHIDRHSIALEPVSADLGDAGGGGDGQVAELLALLDVGHVDLDGGDADGLERIVDGVAVMRVSAAAFSICFKSLHNTLYIIF